MIIRKPVKSKKKPEFVTTPEMQGKIIALMYQDPSFLKEVSGSILPELFDSKIHQVLVEIALDFSKASPGEKVTEAVVLEEMRRKTPEEEHPYVLDTFRAITSDPLTEREYVKDSITPFVQQRKVEDALRLAADAYEHHDYKEIRRLINEAVDYSLEMKGIPTKRKSTKELMMKEFKEPKWLIPGILPEGVSLLVGRPKMGKSYMILESLIAMSCGGYALGNEELRCPKRGVLYISLEDGERRLKSRIRDLAGESGFNDNFCFETEWPKLDQGGAQKLESWLDDNPDVDVVVIDTWQRIKGKTSGKANAYENDVDLMAPLKVMADRRGISVVLVHHSRKASAPDPLDEVSGSTGLTGSVDAILLLRRDKTGNSTLYVRGRDVEENEYALKRSETGGWTLEGKAEDRLTPDQQQIVDLLKARGTLRMMEIAEGIWKTRQATNDIIKRLVNKGVIILAPYGGYMLKSESDLSVSLS